MSKKINQEPSAQALAIAAANRARIGMKPAFTPYKPPIIQKLDEAGGGPSTPAADLLHRMGKREVDEEVVAVVAWACSHFEAIPTHAALWNGADPSQPRIKTVQKLREKIQGELLDDLGLAWVSTRMGGEELQPKAEFLKPAKKIRIPTQESRTAPYGDSSREDLS